MHGLLVSGVNSLLPILQYSFFLYVAFVESNNTSHIYLSLLNKCYKHDNHCMQKKSEFYSFTRTLHDRGGILKDINAVLNEHFKLEISKKQAMIRNDKTIKYYY